MFKGFQGVKYPEYEVICPQTLLSFNVRTLTVQDEEKLKGSLLTPLQITDHLNKCIFDCISKHPDVCLNENNIPDYNKFLKNVTLKDRDSLLFGLYHTSYGEIRNYKVNCGLPDCKREYNITVDASDTFNYNLYPYTEDGAVDYINDREVVVPLKIFSSVKVRIKQPTLFDEIQAYKTVGKRPGSTNELIISTLPIASFEEDVESSKDPVIYKEKEDILDAYKSLPSVDKKLINEKYQEEFGQYGVELKTRAHCPSCGNEEIKYIDLVEVFFSMVYSG